MPYIGQDLQVAYPTYLNIDDISGSFNGSTTSFALLVNGAAPVPLPLNSQQCLISVGGVIQRPDDSGTEGFRLSGGNIIFSSAPNTGEDFFGVILAGADYVNVGANFPDGSQAAPSITFEQDNDTGFYRSGSGLVSVSSNNTKVFTFPSTAGSNGQYLQTDGAGTATWASVAIDKISEGNTEAEVVDTGSDGHFKVTTEGTERMRVDTSGRLLVGTSTGRTGISASLQSLVQVETSSSAAYQAINNSNDGNGAWLALGKSRGTSAGGVTAVQNNDELGYIGFLGADGTDVNSLAAVIAAYVDGTPGNNDMPGRLVFSTTADGAASPTERMRITNGGNILLGSDNSSLTAEEGIKFVNVSSSGPYMGIVANTAIAGDTFYHYYNLNATYNGYRFYVKNDGGIANFSANNVNLCDEREKKNIENLDSTWDCLKHWELKKFNYNEDADTEAPRYGVIAQQVEPHCPEVITEWKKGKDDNGDDIIRMGVKEQQMYWMAIKALQEAQVRIEQLEAKVAALEGASPNP